MKKRSPPTQITQGNKKFPIRLMRSAITKKTRQDEQQN